MELCVALTFQLKSVRLLQTTFYERKSSMTKSIILKYMHLNTIARKANAPKHQ